MQVKIKYGLKMVVAVLTILLSAAITIALTGAWYQTQRNASGTLGLTKGIIVDYTGFGKESVGIWERENDTITYKLFSDTEVLPGRSVTLNSAGIRANTASIDFYARIKLTYKFFSGTTLVTLEDPSSLITQSSEFYGSDWVDSGKNDGYLYYASGSTLSKFTSTSTTFINIFAEDAKFTIEGLNFVGADNGGGGGYVVNESTTIDKIEIYLTLEVIQSDADVESAGWEIGTPV